MDGPTSRAGEIYTELRTLPLGESAKQEKPMNRREFLNSLAAIGAAMPIRFAPDEP